MTIIDNCVTYQAKSDNQALCMICKTNFILSIKNGLIYTKVDYLGTHCIPSPKTPIANCKDYIVGATT